MSILKRRRAQNLSEWLHIATGKLAPMAVWRISTDITSHYEEAVEGHIESGLPMCAAQAAALADLGDAKAAARRFRREHLTRGEFRSVSGLLRSGRCNWLGQVVATALFCLVCFISFLDLRQFRTTNILLYVVVALLPVLRIIALALARYESAVPTPRLVVLMTSVNTFGYGILALVQWTNLFPIPLTLGSGLVVFFWWLVIHLFGIACSLWVLRYSLRLFRLRNKLGTMTDDWMGATGTAQSEIPPDKPVAS
jgi:hypothetical protein